MPRGPTLSRRLATAARWPLGLGLTSWRYLWRTTPMRRHEEPGAWPDDGPPALPEGVSRERVQGPHDGTGPLFHRRYRARIADARMSSEALIERLCADPDQASPTEFASFDKVLGEDGRMAVGDEYVVRMPGPWDGPVRVVERTPACFRLATLWGHLEAGQIMFAADGGEPLEFTIESWACSADRLSDLMYDRLRMSKEVQLHMWTSFLERVIEISGGKRHGLLEIHTRRVEQDVRPLGHPEARHALDELHERALNFELPTRAAMTPENGWRIDDYRRRLPSEPPGDPVPGGTWERARALMRDYEFADPSIVRAVYRDDSPLEGRDMLLTVRFWGLRFRLGVRVAGVIDETRRVDRRDVRVWGWCYGTLQGHLEMGEMDYEVWKWLDSGDVEFRIHVVSRAAEIRNPIVRLGFRLLGRREQVRFARNACERMARLTAGERLPRAADAVVVRGSAAR